MADVTATASVAVTVRAEAAGVVASAHVAVGTVLQATEMVVREVQTLGFTVAQLRQLRDIVRDSQTIEDESPISKRLSAEAAPGGRAVGEDAVARWHGGVHVDQYGCCDPNVPDLLGDIVRRSTRGHASRDEGDPAQIEQIIEQVVKDLDPERPAPHEPHTPPTT